MRPPRATRPFFPALVAAGMIAAWTPSALAQGWSAQLVLSPMATPFLSDWEVDPSQGELLVTNGTAAAGSVTFHYTVTLGNQVVLRGKTDPHTVGANQTVVFNAKSSFGGRADWSRHLQDIVARTGRLPEGEYQACVTLAGAGGAVLVERECAQFSIGFGDPPFLVFPMNGDTITSQAPIFEWQPVQLSPTADTRVGYVLQVAEVRTSAKQRPEAALESNILHHREPGLSATPHQYPVGALPLVSGRTYAWRVQALDGTGRPVASNQGRSEIWTFVYREPESESQRTIARVEISANRDTLRFSGDTSRYVVRAYDADNVEIVGKPVAWRSLDTTVVRVDSTGLVSSVAIGQTRIVATVDGAADSALAVMARRTLAVRFARFDTKTEKPPLLALIESGSFEDVVPRLMDMLESGELVIPIPRLAAEALPAAPEGQDDGGSSRGGPSADLLSAPGSRPRLPAFADDCDVVSGDASVSLDRDRKVWGLQLAVTKELRQCLAPRVMLPPDTGLHVAVIFAASWKHPGLPRVLLASKTVFPFKMPLLGYESRPGYMVLNLSRSVELDSELLPADYAHFMGGESVEAGTGLTAVASFACVDPESPLCRVFLAINPENPVLTLQAFAGITASETALGSETGSSLALGFSIEATLPVKRLDIDLGALSIDSIQGGLSFAVQDSMVTSAGSSAGSNWSVGVAPIVTVWVKGANGNTWAINGAVTLEWDPTKAHLTHYWPKLVVSADLEQVWKLSVVRLGNPTLYFTTPIGPREKREATDIALSGTWGFGPHEGFGIASEGNFDEIGRGQVKFTWERERTAAQQAPYKAIRDSAMVAVTQQLHVVREAKAALAKASTERALARGDSRRTPEAVDAGKLAAAEKAYTDAEKTLKDAERRLEDLRTARKAARDGVVNNDCWIKTAKGMCLNFTASLSFGNGALADLLAVIPRLGMP